MAQQPDFLSLGTYLHQVAGILRHRSFHRLLNSDKSRFPKANSQVAITRLRDSLLGGLTSALPFDMDTELRRARLSSMSAEKWRLLTDVVAGRLASFADSITDYQLTQKQTDFRVPRGKSFYGCALSVLTYKAHWGNVQTLTWLRSPDGNMITDKPTAYISDALFEVRAFVASMSVLEKETGISGYEKVLEWAFNQPENYWAVCYVHDLLLHDFDSVKRQQHKHGYIRLQKTHLSTFYSDESQPDREDTVEFRV